MIINLQDTTFIIPIYIDTKDRLDNVKSVLGYLNKNFKTNIIIHEYITDKSELNFLNRFTNLKIKHLKENFKSVFHRTNQLNKMLQLVETEVVCNYDIDVILPPASYIISEKLLKDNIYDVVYPYGFGKYQFKISQQLDRKIFNRKFLISDIVDNYLEQEKSEYGHCIFFRTDSYKHMGGENENFIAYGPEDKERYKRCHRFGLRMYRIKDFIYHFEHQRIQFSTVENPYFNSNQVLYNELEDLSNNQFLKYYENQQYCKEFNFEIKKFTFFKNDLYQTDESNSTYKNDNIPVDLSNTVEQSEIKNIENLQKNNYNTLIYPNLQNNICRCGKPINKIKYNYCYNCGKIY
jgi:hypothetical protein